MSYQITWFNLQSTPLSPYLKGNHHREWPTQESPVEKLNFQMFLLSKLQSRCCSIFSKCQILVTVVFTQVWWMKTFSLSRHLNPNLSDILLEFPLQCWIVFLPYIIIHILASCTFVLTVLNVMYLFCFHCEKSCVYVNQTVYKEVWYLQRTNSPSVISSSLSVFLLISSSLPLFLSVSISVPSHLYCFLFFSSLLFSLFCLLFSTVHHFLLALFHV